MADDDLHAQFDAIIRDNQLDETQPAGLDELALIVTSLTGAAMHVSHLLLENFDSETPESLNIPLEMARILRMLYKTSEEFMDMITEDLYEGMDDEDDDEDYEDE